jgi:hypothetical protein
LVQVYNHFGPTYPGVFDVARSVYRLSYPGISFEFVIPKEFVHLYQRQSLADLPLEFDDNTSPPAARISIYEEPPSNNNNNNNKNNTAAAASIDDDIIVQIGVGIQRGTDMVTFASSAQDLLSTLGQPNRIHVKQHDKLRIHSASHADAPLADYFYNYFDLGIDFLLDGQRHCVKKIILHTNLPSHTEFNRYAKCPFRIQLGGGGGAHSAPSSDGEQASDGSGSDGSSGSAGGSAGGGGIAIGTIGPNARFEHVQQLLGPVSSQPVVHNRGTAENPFGALLFYGYEHMIFEVTQNGYLASVCLFE